MLALYYAYLVQFVNDLDTPNRIVGPHSHDCGHENLLVVFTCILRLNDLFVVYLSESLQVLQALLGPEKHALCEKFAFLVLSQLKPLQRFPERLSGFLVAQLLNDGLGLLGLFGFLAVPEVLGILQRLRLLRQGNVPVEAVVDLLLQLPSERHPHERPEQVQHRLLGGVFLELSKQLVCLEIELTDVERHKVQDSFSEVGRGLVQAGHKSDKSVLDTDFEVFPAFLALIGDAQEQRSVEDRRLKLGCGMQQRINSSIDNEVLLFDPFMSVHAVEVVSSHLLGVRESLNSHAYHIIVH